MSNINFDSGTRRVKFRYDLIRNGVPVCALPVTAANISHDTNSTIKTTAHFEMLPDDRVVWTSDRIKAHMLIYTGERTDGVVNLSTWANVAELTWAVLNEYTWAEIFEGSADADTEMWQDNPLGLFIPLSPERNYDGSAAIMSVDAYDLTVVLVEDCITSALYIAAGTNYITAINTVLTSAGIDNVIAEPTAATLATAREFEIGTSKIEIINTLLSEINYDTLTVDADGVVLLQKYVEPNAGSIDIEYKADELSVICPESTIAQDLYGVPNVFIAVVSSSEQEPLVSTYTNDNAASPLSTVQRGRQIVAPLYKPDSITSQTELNAFVRRMAFEASQINEEVTFATALMPNHGDGDVLYILHPEINGIYKELSWDMDLTAGGKMNHKARKVIPV